MILTIETRTPGSWPLVWAIVSGATIALIFFLYNLISYIALAKEHPEKEVYEDKRGVLPPLVFHRSSLVKEELEIFFNRAFWGFLIFLVLGINLCWIIPLTIHEDTSYKEWYCAEYEEVVYDQIYSLDFQNETSGKFRLGYGEIQTKHYYYFYIKVKQDTYSFAKLENKGGNTFIEETDDYGSIIQRKDKNSDFVYYLIKVPHGTVIESYSVI